MNITSAHLLLPLTLTLGVLTACGTNGAPNAVHGTVVDARNAAVAGAQVFIAPANLGLMGAATYTGEIALTTNSHGQYQSAALSRAGNPYVVSAYNKVVYHDRTYCLRMADETGPFREPIEVTRGAIRNFHWKIQGVSDTPTATDGSGFWGGSVIMNSAFEYPTDPIPADATIKLTFVPLGPLIDGSTGGTVSRAGPFNDVAKDIPVGFYRVTAELIENGQNQPLLVGTGNTGLSDTADLLFSGYDTCGHSGTLKNTNLWLERIPVINHPV